MDNNLSQVAEPIRLSGRVVRCQSGFFFVETATSDIVTCQITGRMKNEAFRAEQKDEATRSDLVALNDTVSFELQADGSGVILEVAERRNTLSRTEPSAKVGTSAETEQIIITNLDQVIFVFAATHPRPQPRALDRLLVIAEKARIPSIVICVNKADLATPEEIEAVFGVYERIGYRVLRVSAQRGDNMDELRALVERDNTVSVLTGPSGVGKSSILNAIQTGLALATQDVSTATTKGRHTTRFSQLLALDSGGYVADTPGIRSIAPWDIEPEELENYFIEFRPYLAQCKFANCAHIQEPDCAILAAVEAGHITPERHDSYLRLREELEEQYIY